MGSLMLMPAQKSKNYSYFFFPGHVSLIKIQGGINKEQKYVVKVSRSSTADFFLAWGI